MIPRLTLHLLAWTFLQGSEIDRLAEQLGHEDGAVRQKAEKRLLEIGEPARPALERLGVGGDLEVRTRTRALLAALDQTALRAKWLGPRWTVTLAEGNYVLGDLPRLLKEQVPVPLEIPAGLASSRVRLGANGMGAWAFLDRLCEVHGGLAVPLERPEGAFALEEGKPAHAPTCYSGPFRLWIDKLTLETRNPYGTVWRGARMVLAITWQPNVHPLNRDYLRGDFDFKISEITDEKGIALDLKEPPFESGSGSTLDRTRESVWRSWKTLTTPPPHVRRLSRVRGTVKMVFPADVAMIEFRSPTEFAAKATRAGGYSVSLASCKRTETGIIARICFSKAAGSGERPDRHGQVELRARYRSESIRIWESDGKSYPFEVRSSSHSSSDGEETAELLGFFPLKGDADKLTFPFVADYFEQDIPFEFLDVELP